MSEPKLISPMLDGFIMGDPISEHAGVRCCPAMRNDADDRYIVKIISNPASQKQLDALLLTGAYPNAEAANSYFKSLTDDVVAEIEVLKKLSESEGFLAFEEYQVSPMENGETGFDVYILSEYRRTLERQFRREPMTHLGAINLGLDLCSALSVCRRAGYLYVDLKPSNIHVLNGQEYRIGDLGFMKLDSLKYASLPDKYRSVYTAPEISDAFASLNTTVDIYALGLILYRAYNAGQLPFSGDSAPAEKFDPPQYADYEMSEIILKACDPDPEQRWQDPMQIGQALVSYMQRNGANDTPIVPPVILSSESEPLSEEISELDDLTVSEEIGESESQFTDTTDPAPADEASEETVFDPSESASETDLQVDEENPAEAASECGSEQTEDEIVYSEDDFGNLSFLSEMEDETAQELDADQIEYEEVSAEVSEILTQADEIAAHQVPDPVIAPEAIDVPMPEPIVLEADEGTEETVCEEIVENENEEASSIEANDEITEGEISEELPANEDDATAPIVEENEDSDESEESAAPKKHVLRNVLLILIGAALITTAVLFYNVFYLQRIDSMVINGNESSITVIIDTQVDENKLSVVCADVYGTKMTKPVIDGKVTFSDLLGGTEYTITVTIDGFHKVSGDYKKTYYTPALTNIVQFGAVTGSEDGSAIISFTVDGPDSEQWQITYSASDEQPQSITFSGHTATIKGLTIGKEYTISLSSVEELYISGEQEITFTANKLIYPEGLAITSYKDNALTVSWSVPEDVSVESWSVHCYNASGYSETVMTSETTVSFDGIDNTQDYTVEVSAVGQSVSQRTTVEENSITLDNVVSEINENGQISLSWNSSVQIPQGGWIIVSKIDGTDFESTYNCEGNEFVIKDTLPEQTYQIEIRAANEAPVVCPPIICETGEAKVFSCSFGGAPISGKEISLSMCHTPAKENWDRNDLKKADYTTTFKVGQNASFVIRALKLYGISDDELIVTYAIKDNDGKLISIQNEEFTWRTLWDYYYGELNIPTLPAVAGAYTVTVYFNSGLVGEQAFTITE